jgi:CheY-like chemotaxis protein
MSDFSALKTLVVEDEGAVALLIEDMLSSLGCEIVASVAQVTTACAIAKASPLDFAVLDVNLNGESVFAVARVLHERRIPFVFSTGYGDGGVLPEFARYPVLNKPFRLADLRRVVTAALARPEA